LLSRPKGLSRAFFRHDCDGALFCAHVVSDKYKVLTPDSPVRDAIGMDFCPVPGAVQGCIYFPVSGEVVAGWSGPGLGDGAGQPFNRK
jgi:hypothetical protein